MPFVASRNRVADFDAWKRTYDQGAAMRREMGMERQQILRNPDDPNEFLLLIEVDSVEQARQAAQSDKLRAQIQRSGVLERSLYFPES
jgi:hypothetical protein